MADSTIVRCPSCGTNNRISPERLRNGSAPVCGKCKEPLPVSSGPVTVTDSSFAAEVEQSSLPVLLDLWAEWCGPCHMIAPTVEQIANETAGRLKVGKLNIDQNPLTAARFGVKSIPTLLIFKSGREVDRIVGVQSKAAILSRLQRLV